MRLPSGARLVHERAAVYVQDVPSNERGLRRAQEPRALGHFLRRPETVQGHFLSDNRAMIPWGSWFLAQGRGLRRLLGFRRGQAPLPAT